MQSVIFRSGKKLLSLRTKVQKARFDSITITK